MTTPGISIVIPSYNQGQYIERTLLSIFKQEYDGKIEVIVSDGGSTDNTVDVLKKYDNQITWWSEKDEGYADAVNKGFKRSSYEICAIQSSDDYYLKNAFKEIIEKFQQHSDASLICGREVIQNPDGNIFGGYTLPETITPRSFLLDHPFPGIFQHTTFFKHAYYDKSGGLRQKYDMCADADLFYRLLHFGKGYYLNKYIAVYQRHEAQRTNTQTLKFETQLLDMVLDCKNDPCYNMVYTPAERDYFLYSTFINLFYLQYVNKGNARLKAAELVDNADIDDRIRNLAHQLLDSSEPIRRQPLLEIQAKLGRIISHLYKKYIIQSKNDIPANHVDAFKEIIKPDWWQN